MIKSLFILLVLLSSCSQNKPSPVSSCPFCNEEVLKRQGIHEDAHTLVLYTHKPMMDGHTLIVPKRHVERYEELTDEEILSIHRMIKKTHSAVSKHFGTRSYLLLQKNGKEVGQTVPHLHIHYLPRKEDGSNATALLWGFCINPFRSAMNEEEMREKVTSLSETFHLLFSREIPYKK